MEKSQLGESPCPPVGLLWGLSGEPFAVCVPAEELCASHRHGSSLGLWTGGRWCGASLKWMGFGLEGDGAGPCWARSYRAAWGPVVWHLLLAMPRSTLPKGVTAFGAASLGLQVLVPLDGSPKVGQAFGFGQAGAAASRAEGPQGSTRGRPAPLGLLTGCRHLGDAG